MNSKKFGANRNSVRTFIRDVLGRLQRVKIATGWARDAMRLPVQRGRGGAGLSPSRA